MRLPAITRASIRRPGPVPTFAVAVLLGGLIAVLRAPLQGVLGGASPFILAWPGMMLAGYIGGFWPTIVVAALGFGIGQWALTAAGGDPLGPTGMIIFAAFTLVIAGAAGALKTSRRRARADAARIAQLQAQMVQVARLNAVGEMAGVLAHELNQPLTAIGNYLSATEQILAREHDANARPIELLRKAAGQAIRAGQIVARVRAGVESGEVAFAEESLSGLAHDAVEAALAGLGDDGLSIRFDFDRAADGVRADRIQVQQVLLNLVRNAVEAMDGQPRRELQITSRPADGGMVEVCVADTGPGIAPEVAGHLFQPFVSGKAGGMGVGLSISRHIVEAHGGRLWAGAAPGGGAAIRFTLQRADAERAS